MNTHIGSDFDDFLAEQGLAEEVSCAALKRVIAWQVAEAMKSKKALASATRAPGLRVEVQLAPDTAHGGR